MSLHHPPAMPSQDPVVGAGTKGLLLGAGEKGPLPSQVARGSQIWARGHRPQSGVRSAQPCLGLVPCPFS